jgi:hypothetical protein
MEMAEEPSPPLLPIMAASCLLVSIAVVGLWLFDSLYPVGVSAVTRLVGAFFTGLS